MMELFQEIPAALKAVDHTSPRTAVARGKVLLERGGELTDIMQQCGEICGIFEPDWPQTLRRPPCRTN